MYWRILNWLLAAFFLTTVSLAEAQQPKKFPPIGFLGNSTAALEANLIGPFREGMRDLGYIEGQNITIEYRWAEGKYERFPELIGELVGRKVEIIVTAGTPAAVAVKKAAPTIPLVMIAVGDPIGTGLIASLAQPGGNVTGLSSMAADLEGKRLELLREVIPKLSHVAVFKNPANAFHVFSEKEVQAAAQAFKMKVLSLGVQSPEQFDNAFATIRRVRPGALLILADRLFLHNRTRMMDFAVQNRLPGVYPYQELVEAGGLMSYGPSYPDMHKRAATFVDKILKGRKPSDLPVEQPMKFEFVINLKAAKKIGLTVPQWTLMKADRVIR